MTDDEAFDRIERAAVRLDRRARWEQGNRVGLLRIHAAVGIVTGLQILAYGSAANIEESVGLWVRTALGLLAVTGGLLLAVGIASRPRGIYNEALGLALLGLWDLCMMAGFIKARVDMGDYSIRALTEPLPEPGTYVLPYPIGIYAGLFGLICVHLWTLRRFKRGL